MIKVLFIIQDDRLPSSRIRVLNLLPEIQKYGIETDVVQYPKNNLDKISLIKKCANYDITYLQKKLLSPVDAFLLRKFARKLIFDFDDAIYYRQYDHKTSRSWSRYKKFKYLIKQVDIVVAGNRILADNAGWLNKNVFILPSAVETRNIPLKEHNGPDDKTIIGWVGGEVNLPYLKILSHSVLPRLSMEHKIDFRILSSKTIEIPSVEVTFIPWSLETQEREIALFDIGVMPLPDNKYTEGKCAYKALQYMAASVPPVCSDVGVNSDIIENGRDGFVVQSEDEYYNVLSMLIENKDLRIKMGHNARIKVEGNYSIPIIGKKLSNILKL
ncbi:MAG: glycosyltransferase family 4 protein [Nitrospirae bacterium]|nr:glycosyltransferase family 4 protein [Nitrospirota bacterium]